MIKHFLVIAYQQTIYHDVLLESTKPNLCEQLWVFVRVVPENF